MFITGQQLTAADLRAAITGRLADVARQIAPHRIHIDDFRHANTQALRAVGAMTPESPAYMIIGKDRSTVLGALGSVRTLRFESRVGALVVLEAEYAGGVSFKSVKRFVNVPLATASASGVIGERLSTKRIRLQDRGWALIVVGRSAFTHAPSGLRLTPLGDYKATSQQIVDRVR